MTMLSRLLAAAALAATVSSAQAAWVQNDELLGALDNNYTTQRAGNLASVTFTDQQAVNAGSHDGHFGWYFGWSWVRPSDAGSSTYQPLLWDNATQRFTNGSVSLEVQYLGHAPQFLRLSDVQADTWVGVPWTFDPAVTAIATQGDWEVPLFDLGFIAAGQSALYDIRFNFTFAGGDAEAQAFLDRGGFGSYAQGVEMPEPLSLGLVALALGLVAVTTPRRGNGRLGPAA
jgi:hypothetical protein